MKRALQKGFTLIELVVVIVILGILAAVAIPQFVDTSAAARTAVGNSACGALQSSAVLLFASNKTASPIATIIGNTQTQGVVLVGTGCGPNAVTAYVPDQATATAAGAGAGGIVACTAAIPAALCTP